MSKKHYRQNKPVEKTKYEYRTVDGNWTNHPCAYCKRYHGVLTLGIMQTHKCKQINCCRLNTNIKFE